MRVCNCNTDCFVVEEEEQRTEVSHHLHKTEHSVNVSPFPLTLNHWPSAGCSAAGTLMAALRHLLDSFPLEGHEAAGERAVHAGEVRLGHV